MTRRRRSTALHYFTLIEMLVVIAIIALLASLLLPSLRISIENAIIVKCANNLRQIATAVEVYANDWYGAMPRPGWDISPVTALRTLHPDEYPAQIFLCPKGENNNRDPAWGNLLQTNYTMNIRLVDDSLGVICDKLDKVPRPSSTLLFVEESEWCIDNGHFTFYYDDKKKWRNMVSARHLHGANMLFVDSHIEYWKWEEPSTGVIDYAYWLSVKDTGGFPFNGQEIDAFRLDKAMRGL